MEHIVVKKGKEKMEKSLTVLGGELGKVRTGRASTALLDDIRVEYYGTMTPLNQVATLGAPEPRLLTISPWDPSVISLIEKAINTSDLGLNPSNDGKIIRIPIPPLTEERRKEMVKIVRKFGEESRVAVRHIRREALDELSALEKSKTINEDDHKHLNNEVQKITDLYIKKIDEIMDHKEKEVMEV